MNLKGHSIFSRNMNFHEEFPDIEIDQKVSPLHCSTYLGKLEITKMILQNPTIDIDIASYPSGHTPLQLACTTGNYEIVDLLLEYGAEPNKPNKFSQTPLVSCFNRLDEENYAYENKKICFKTASLLLDYGADINWIVDKMKGMTLLMQLCDVKMKMSRKEQSINLEIIKFLCEHGAEKEMPTLKGKSIEDIANKHSNKTEVLDILSKTEHTYIHDPLEMKKLQMRKLVPFPRNLAGSNSGKKHKKSKSLFHFMGLCNR